MLSFLRRRPTAAKPVARPNLAPAAWLVDLKRRAQLADNELLTVDLANVPRISSRDLGDLVRIQLKLREQERQLVLENVEEPVWDVLQLTRLDRLIEIHSAHPLTSLVS